MSSRADVGDLDNSLLSWVSEHLGEKSFMTDEVNGLPSSPQEESFDHGENPEMENRPPPEREVSIMTQGKLNHLRESCSFLSGIQARLPKMTK